MKKLGKVLLGILGVVVALVLVVVVIRVINDQRYPDPEGFTPQDAASYSLTQPGMKIERVQGDYLNGFHFKPDQVKHQGLVVVFGGSEGSPDYNRAKQLAGEGYEVLGLFFFGQPNQRPLLSEVPLDFFDEVLQWRTKNNNTGPLTVIGTSKGAEITLALQARYPEIDQAVVFTPTAYSYPGLEFGRYEKGSWFYKNEPVPYLSFRKADASTMWPMFSAMLFNSPFRYREQYASTLANASPEEKDAARFPIKAKKVVAFAGDQDAMWPAEEAAQELAKSSPNVEPHIYPGAGHMFGPVGEYIGKVEMGGSQPANEAAKADSDKVLLTRLAEWHPAV